MKIINFALIAAVSLASVGCSILKDKSKSQESTVISSNEELSEQKENPGEIKISDPAKQLSGEWTMLTVNNKKIKTLERPFINFDFKNKRIYGNNGCNVINGNFTCQGQSLKFDQIISTMMACDNETSERAIMKALNNTVAVKLYDRGGIKQLHLIDKNGNTLATLKNQNLDFMNGAWTVKELDGKEVHDDNVRLVIDIDQLKLHGNSGCNIINGSLFIDYSKDWAIQFQELISTMKMCENMKTETALLIALEVTETCKKINDNEVALLDKSGKIVAKFIRLDIAK